MHFSSRVSAQATAGPQKRSNGRLGLPEKKISKKIPLPPRQQKEAWDTSSKHTSWLAFETSSGAFSFSGICSKTLRADRRKCRIQNERGRHIITGTNLYISFLQYFPTLHFPTLRLLTLYLPNLYFLTLYLALCAFIPCAS